MALAHALASSALRLAHLAMGCACRVSASNQKRLTVFLSLCDLMCALAILAAPIYDFVTRPPKSWFENSFFTPVLVRVYLVLLALLLAASALLKSERLYKIFGFLRFSAGTGIYLIFLGGIVTGIAGKIGLGAGIASMVVGSFHLLAICFLSSSTASTKNSPLLDAF